MDEVVAANGQPVTVTGNLPHGDIRIGHLETGSNGCGTPVNRLHGIRIHIIWQTAGATDT